jgi:hypothetical protein
MGLDMYLFERKTGTELMYWRKANQIRRWFVDHLNDFDPSDNLGKYDVSREVLQDLIDDIDYVLEDESIERAEEVMPTNSGFFFGNTEYDEYYFDSLRHTRKQIQEILDTTSEEDEIYYTEWW